MKTLISTLLLVAMTYERFYSIIRPHKAASFNTVKRAKITITFIILFSILYNIPHIFISDNEGWQCTPFGKAKATVIGQIFYWFSFLVEFALPFVLLLSMNSVIIPKLHTRSMVTQSPRQQSVKPDTTRKNSEAQIFVMLLLVTFGFLILITPAYIFYLYVILVNFLSSPKAFAGYHLFYNIAQKFRFTNHGVNFLFYVISVKNSELIWRNFFVFQRIFRKRRIFNIIQTFLVFQSSSSMVSPLDVKCCPKVIYAC